MFARSKPTPDPDAAFTMIPQFTLDWLILAKLNDTHRRIALLVIRLTYGCHRQWAMLKGADLQATGINPAHAREALESFMITGVLIQNGTNRQFRLDEAKMKLLVKNSDQKKQKRLKNSISAQLKDYIHQVGNGPVTKEEMSSTRTWKPSIIPDGNSSGFPAEELQTRKHSEKPITKDTSNIPIKDIPKDNLIGVRSGKGFTKVGDRPYRSKENPFTYGALNATEQAAKEICIQIETDPQNSFAFYRSAIKNKNVTAQILYDLRDEVLASPNIKNKGAAMNVMIQQFMDEHPGMDSSS